MGMFILKALYFSVTSLRFFIRLCKFSSVTLDPC